MSERCLVCRLRAAIVDLLTPCPECVEPTAEVAHECWQAKDRARALLAEFDASNGMGCTCDPRP